MPTFYTNSGSLRSLEVSGSTLISGSSERLVRIIGTGSAILSISASTGPILEVSEFAPAGSNKMLVFTSGSVDVFSIQRNSKVVITGSLEISNSLTASLQQGYVWVGNADGKTSLVPTSSFGGGGGSGFPYTGDALISGSLTLTGSMFIEEGEIKFNPGAADTPQGVRFPNPVIGGSDNRLMQYYELESWTPSFSAAGATFSYNSREGYYARIGGFIHIWFKIILNTTGNSGFGANDLTITGFPLVNYSVPAVGDLHWKFTANTAIRFPFSITSNVIDLYKVTAATTSVYATTMKSNDLGVATGTEVYGNIAILSEVVI